MNSYSYFICISIILIKIVIIQTHNSNEICVENPFQTISANNFTVCYLNDIENHSILVWFTIGKIVNDTFDSYRFILRSIDDHKISSNIMIKILTDFTKLIDFYNSLRIFYLDSGQYEICIEFQSNFTKFIYQPRDGCIAIEIGHLIHRSFHQSSIPLLIALTSGIVLFFILGLVVQWFKTKHQNNSNNNNKLRQSHSSHVFSTAALKQQSDRIIRNLFSRHIDQPRSSRIHQWARNRAFRHRISTQEHEFDTSKCGSLNQSFPPNLITSHISQQQQHSKMSFDLYPSNEEYEMRKY